MIFFMNNNIYFVGFEVVMILWLLMGWCSGVVWGLV